MVKRFNADAFVEEEHSLLEYVRILAQKIRPDFEVTAGGHIELFESQAPFTFVHRYNSGAISLKDDYSKYTENKDISLYLSQLKLSDNSQLDLEKFWYLLLFAYDYSKGECLTPECQVSETAAKELSRLVELIDQSPQEQITMSVQINGKNVLDIENELSIKYITDSCRHLPDELTRNIVLSVINRKGNTNSDWGIYFCELLHIFFDEIGVIRNKTAKWSDNEKRVLCHILYFTGICTNRNILNFDLNDFGTLKTFIKPKSTVIIRTLNKYYF